MTDTLIVIVLVVGCIIVPIALMWLVFWLLDIGQYGRRKR